MGSVIENIVKVSGIMEISVLCGITEVLKMPAHTFDFPIYLYKRKCNMDTSMKTKPADTEELF